jgi:uncharacterized protein (DUF885 family)
MSKIRALLVLLVVLTLVCGCGCGTGTTPAATVDEIVAELADLDFDAFLEVSYTHLLLRDPELITELGLSDELGVGNDRLTDISDAYVRETQQVEIAVLERLNQYDRAALTPEQQLSAEIYAWYLDDRVAGHPFMYNDYPVTHFITGAQNQLVHFFTDIHPVTDLQDAQDYVARLSQVDRKFQQLVGGLELREKAGVILPKFIVQWVLYDLRNMARSTPQATPFYTAFEDKVQALERVSDAERASLLRDAEAEIGKSVLPAYQELVDYFEHLETVATDDPGVDRFSNGEAYYAYALRHHTTTDMTAGEIHELGLQEVSRLRTEMQVLFDELGYPGDESLPELFSRVARDGGTLSGSAIVAGYEDIIEDAEKRTEVAFDLLPTASVEVVGGPTGGYYVPPAMDGSRPGVFYASAIGTQPKFNMPTLAYHEAIPGHHLQLALAQELDLPAFRHNVVFTAYAEGWALYAERLAWELGLYEDDPCGNLGRLQFEAFRAVRLVVDTGVHTKGWTYDQAVTYMVENTGLPRQMVEFEVSRYITWPGQATAYKIGMIRVLALRQRAEDQLGDRFDLLEFHNVVLGSGSVPLETLDGLVNDYIENVQSDK